MTSIRRSINKKRARHGVLPPTRARKDAAPRLGLWGNLDDTSRRAAKLAADSDTELAHFTTAEWDMMERLCAPLLHHGERHIFNARLALYALYGTEGLHRRFANLIESVRRRTPVAAFTPAHSAALQARFPRGTKGATFADPVLAAVSEADWKLFVRYMPHLRALKALVPGHRVAHSAFALAVAGSEARLRTYAGGFCRDIGVTDVQWRDIQALWKGLAAAEAGTRLMYLRRGIRALLAAGPLVYGGETIVDFDAAADAPVVLQHGKRVVLEREVQPTHVEFKLPLSISAFLSTASQEPLVLRGAREWENEVREHVEARYLHKDVMGIVLEYTVLVRF